MASKRSPHAPLASAEDIDQHGYAIPRDNVVSSQHQQQQQLQQQQQQQQQSGSSGGSRGSAGSKSKPPKGEAPRLKSNSEYAQPVELPQQAAARKSKHRERRQQMALQQGNEITKSVYCLSNTIQLLFVEAVKKVSRHFVNRFKHACPSFFENVLRHCFFLRQQTIPIQIRTLRAKRKSLRTEAAAEDGKRPEEDHPAVKSATGRRGAWPSRWQPLKFRPFPPPRLNPDPFRKQRQT